MITKFLFAFLVVALILEGTVTTLPLVLVSLILLTIELKNNDMFLYAFLAGIVLDIFLVRPVGTSSVFFLITLLMIFLYDRKYELRSHFFVAVITMFMTVLYSIFFPAPHPLFMTLTTTLLSLFLYSLVKAFQPKI